MKTHGWNGVVRFVEVSENVRTEAMKRCFFFSQQSSTEKMNEKFVIDTSLLNLTENNFDMC